MNTFASLLPQDFFALALLSISLLLGACLSSVRWVDNGIRRIFFWFPWAMTLSLTLFSWWQVNRIVAQRVSFQLWPGMTLQSDGRFAQSVQFFFRLSLDNVSAFYLVSLLLVVGVVVYLKGEGGDEASKPSGRYAALSWFLLFSSLAILSDQLALFIVGSSAAALCVTWFVLGETLPDQSSTATQKIVRRVLLTLAGDSVLMLAAGLLAYYLGAIDWPGIHAGRSSLESPLRIWPITTEMPIARLLPSDWQEILLSERSASVGGVIGFCLSLGIVIKHDLWPFTRATALSSSLSQPWVFALETVSLGSSLYLLERLRALLFISPAVSGLLLTLALLCCLRSAFRACSSETGCSFIEQVAYFQTALLLSAAGVGASWAITWGYLGFVLLQIGLSLSLGLSQRRLPTFAGPFSSLLSPKAVGIILMLSALSAPYTLGFWSSVDIISAGLNPRNEPLRVARFGRNIVEIWQYPSWWSFAVVSLFLACLLLFSFSAVRTYHKKLDWGAHAIVPSKRELARFGLVPLMSCIGILSLLLGLLWSAFFFSKEPPLLPLVLACSAISSGVLLSWLNYEVLKARPTQAFVNYWAKRFVVVKRPQDALNSKGLFDRAMDSLSEIVFFIDEFLIRKIFYEITNLFSAVLGTILRFSQSGRSSNYGLIMLFALVGAAIFLLSPSAHIEVQRDDRRGVYTLIAPQSFGMAVDWDLNNDGIWDASQGTHSRRQVLVEMLSERRVRTRIRGALGWNKIDNIIIKRPYVPNAVPAYRKWKNTSRTPTNTGLSKAGESQ